jgi:hypothetical protein
MNGCPFSGKRDYRRVGEFGACAKPKQDFARGGQTHALRLRFGPDLI